MSKANKIPPTSKQIVGDLIVTKYHLNCQLNRRFCLLSLLKPTQIFNFKTGVVIWSLETSLFGRVSLSLQPCNSSESNGQSVCAEVQYFFTSWPIINKDTFNRLHPASEVRWLLYEEPRPGNPPQIERLSSRAYEEIFDGLALEVTLLERTQPISCNTRLSADLGRLLGCQRLTDVTLVAADGREFRAHRAILAARSPVFAAMFEHNMRERREGRVGFEDLAPAVLRVLLEFAYTGRLLTTAEAGPTELLTAAERYQLEDLKQLCEIRLCAAINYDNVVKYLILADLNEAELLKDRTIDFIIDNLYALVYSIEYKAMLKSHGHLTTDILIKMEKRSSRIAMTYKSALQKPKYVVRK